MTEVSRQRSGRWLRANNYPIQARPDLLYSQSTTFLCNCIERGILECQPFNSITPMCARLELNDTCYQSGQSVAVWLEEGHAAWLTWAGSVRRESLDRWLAMGAQLVDIPAQKFAERSNRTHGLLWESIPLGMVVRGIVDSMSGKPILKVVTRAATPEEAARFQHPRMPVIEPPRVSAECILPPHPVSECAVIVQPALFVPS